MRLEDTNATKHVCHIYNKMDTIRDFLEIHASSDGERANSLKEILKTRLQLKDSHTIHVAHTHTLQMQTALGLTHTQLCGMCSFFTRWGAPRLLQGWRVWKQQRDTFKQQLHVRVEMGQKEEPIGEEYVLKKRFP